MFIYGSILENKSKVGSLFFLEIKNDLNFKKLDYLLEPFNI